VFRLTNVFEGMLPKMNEVRLVRDRPQVRFAPDGGEALAKENCERSAILGLRRQEGHIIDDVLRGQHSKLEPRACTFLASGNINLELWCKEGHESCLVRKAGLRARRAGRR